MVVHTVIKKSFLIIGLQRSVFDTAFKDLIYGFVVRFEKFVLYLRTWYWFFVGRCYHCGGTLEEVWDEKHQFCSVCKKNN